MDDDEQVEDDDDAPQLRKYTLEEANAALADVRPVLLELRELWTGANDERESFEHAQSSDQSPVEVSLAHQHLVSALWDVQPLVAKGPQVPNEIVAPTKCVSIQCSSVLPEGHFGHLRMAAFEISDVARVDCGDVNEFHFDSDPGLAWRERPLT